MKQFNPQIPTELLFGVYVNRNIPSNAGINAGFQKTKKNKKQINAAFKYYACQACSVGPDFSCLSSTEFL